ncbi:hypothetical protein G7Z17_g1220 [Cylindrodendrum hubeiense]|uniref:Uncharacterized protein n=1 Tax=Cylindrodendrum hubeiense TaxID=595255 RepID=A0A9P5HIU3_9HYPO|nr:hypothetical protein G7Z17_g1220 [Cylindrodendrum hubeiense]
MHDLEDFILWGDVVHSPDWVAWEEELSEPSALPRAPAVDLNTELSLTNNVHDFNFGALPNLSDESNHGSSFFLDCEYPSFDSGEHVTPVGGLSETPAPLCSTGCTSDSITTSAPDPNDSVPLTKIRPRFSQQSIQILKKWLLLHCHDPYLDEEENAMLQHQTGLNKTQISNWLSNARRRGKVQPAKFTVHRAGNAGTEPIDIPRRPPTPTVKSNMPDLNPLQRWVESPPENEPACVNAIAKAVASTGESSPGTNGPHDSTLDDEASDRSICNGSSASSFGTSSGGSLGSAYSHNSGGSCTSFGRRRRRRRRANPKREEQTSLIEPLKPYQCTFCTETFKTKHVWQRHEKSLHLSLESWVCAPDGPRAVDPKTNQICCVFCAKVNPDDAHVDSHNHATCEMRSPDERTFYRKDHLNQHLRLVHGAKFLDWCMEPWKVTTSDIQSQCGFCGIVMHSWPIRVEHLAEHFKSGNTIAEWKGDWGFEPKVLDMLKNAIPPYLIEMERNSTYPYIATCTPTESPRTAYELITLELSYFMENYQEKNGSLPRNAEMQLEACRVIFASEVLSLEGFSAEPSWLRDLLMTEEISKKARFSPLRQGAENRLAILRINGKDNLFEQCPLELELTKFVCAKISTSLTVTDDELQEECCGIIGRVEDNSKTPSDFISNWLVRLVMSSTSWLVKFRRRANLPASDNTIGPGSNLENITNIDSTIYNYSGLERCLGEYVATQRAMGIWPSNGDLERQARKIMSESEETWNQTADNIDWLAAFKHHHSQNTGAMNGLTSHIQPTTGMQQLSTPSSDLLVQAVNVGRPSSNARNFEGMMKNTFFLNDTNCYRRLAQDLTRFVTSTMSPNNPNRHVPTDAEIQHQARCILFDSDDLWNQTAADNEQWLRRFKRDVGIISAEPTPGGQEGEQPILSQHNEPFL